MTGKKISKVRSSSGAVLGQKWPPLGLSCRTYIFIPTHKYKYIYINTYLGSGQAMSVSKVPWGQRRRELGLNWEPQPRDPIGLLSRRDGNRNFHHGHWLIMFFCISTRIYDFLALRTTAIIICHDSFFNDLRGQQKKDCFAKVCDNLGDDCCLLLCVAL